MSTRPSAGSPAQLLRSLAAVATAAGALAALPSVAHAVEPAPTGAAALQVVVTKTAASKPNVPAVINVRLKNTGTEAYDPAAATLESDTEVSFDLDAEWPRFEGSIRSAHGWDCTVEAGYYDYGTCDLKHVIPAGGSSLPFEVEVVPAYLGESSSAQAWVSIDGWVLVGDPAGGKPSGVSFPVVGSGVDPEDDGQVTLDFSADGVADHPRDPKVVASADRTDVDGAEQATVTFLASSGGTISTGPFNYLPDTRPELRFYTGDASAFPNVKIGATFPADKVVVDDIKFFRLLPETVTIDEATSSAAGTAFGELPVESDRYEANPNTGEYLLTLPSGERLLTDHPVRVVAKVHLKDGVNSAELLGEVSAGPEPLATAGGRVARALLPGSPSAKITITRKAPPVVVPETPATPEQPVTPQTQQQPQSDQGAVLGARAAPRLTGRARFAKAKIRVGQQTKLTLNVTNEGNGASDAGKVCVKLSRALVTVKLPKGVTNQGATLCAKTSAIAATTAGPAIKGIVVRGVAPTRIATVRDGADDGVSLVGDRLQVIGAQARPGGVTG